MNEQEFINKIVPSFQKWGKQYGYKIISAAIAQACLESGYGTSYKATFGHNILGLKYRPNRVNCNDGYFLDGGSEQNPNGTYTPLPSNTAWYNFKDYDACIHGYYQFISISNYNAVRTAQTPLEYLQAIKAAGYATSLDYVKNVYERITNWNLTQYDNNDSKTIANNDKTNINIIQKVSEHNTTFKNNRNIDWIVLHYTAGTSSSKNSAQNIASYFGRTTNQASADFIVDDNDIVQYNKDLKNRYCWAVGGKQYPVKSNSLAAKYYGQCKNDNSISIEMCSRKKNTATLNVTDNDWYLTDATINNTIKLTKYLMQLYNINIDHVIMHNMVTGKWCPQPWCKNENALTEWYNFLNQLKGVSIIKPADTPSNETSVQKNVATSTAALPYTARVTASVLNVRSGPGTNYSINRTVNKNSIYTIVEENKGWGRLKSGAGWVSLKYMQKT